MQAILRRVRANITLRLGNLQVVNKFDDGEERFAHDWLRHNERDMASLAWEIAAVRERRGFGSIKVKVLPLHPQKISRFTYQTIRDSRSYLTAPDGARR